MRAFRSAETTLRRALLACLLSVTLLAAACTSRRPPSGEGDGGNGDGEASDGAPADGASDAAGDGGEDGGLDGAGDGAGDAATDGGDGDAGGNHAPALAVTTPSSSSGAIPLDFFIIDADSDAVTVSLDWSENGTNWSSATIAGGSTSGLASSPTGVAHTLVWGSATDVPARQATVRLRLTPFDGHVSGSAAVSAQFTVDNRAPNTAPTASWGTINSPVTGNATLTFFAADAESDTVNATVEYRLAQGSWSAVALASGSGPLTGLSTSPGGMAASFIWATATNIPADAEQAQLRVTLNDGHAAGTPAESARFSVRNAPRTFGVRISEVTAGTPDWLEVTNTGTSSVSASGWKLSWTSGSSGEVALPTFQIDAGKRVLITEEQGQSSSQTLYLNTPIEWTSAAPGSAALVNAQGQGVDFVRWGGSTDSPPAGTGWSETDAVHIPHDGASIVRSGGRDTDSASDFCAAPATRGGADDACYPAPQPNVSLRLVEVFAGGATAPDASNPGDWVEILNTGTQVDLHDWVVVTDNIQAGTQSAALRSVTIGAGGRLRVVSGPGSDTAGVQYTGTANVDMRILMAGAASLRDPTGRPHDYLRWGGWSAPPPPPVAWTDTSALYTPGRFTSLNRISESSTGVDSVHWCIQRASPGAPGSGCLTSAVGSGMVVNEVGMGGNFFTSGFVELRNRGNGALWVGDWKLSWGSDFIPLDDVTVGSGERPSLVECGIFGGGTGCVSVFFPWGAFSGPAAGSAELVDNTGASVDFVRWGGDTSVPSSGGAWQDTPAGLATPAAAGDSVGRRESSGDTDRAADWCTQAGTSGGANGACK